jgi:hypothetical protein
LRETNTGIGLRFAVSGIVVAVAIMSIPDALERLKHAKSGEICPLASSIRLISSKGITLIAIEENNNQVIIYCVLYYKLLKVGHVKIQCIGMNNYCICICIIKQA